MDELFRAVGMIVCVGGGLALSVAFVGLAVIWAAEKCTNVQAIYRIAKHAREHGLDLRTGKPWKEIRDPE